MKKHASDEQGGHEEGGHASRQWEGKQVMNE